MKTGVIDVGGGLRDIYAVGVFDYFMDKGIKLDYCLGISAGSANCASYLAGQRGRNLKFYTEYAMRPEYMGMRHLVREKSYIDFNYVYGVLSNSDGESPLDYEAIRRNPAELVVEAENAETGLPVYFTKDDIWQDHYNIFMASSCVPGIDRPQIIDGVPYFDGALGDPIPLQRAFDDGCDRIVLILSRPKDVPRPVGKDEYISRAIRRRYPRSAEEMLHRAAKYNRRLEEAKCLERDGRVLIIAPDDTCGISTLTRDRIRLKSLYSRGYRDAAAIHRWFPE